MNMNELWNNILIDVKKSYQDAINIADADGVTQTCAGTMRTTIEGLVRLFYLRYYRKTFEKNTFKLSKSIKNDDFRHYFTGAEYSDIDSIRFVGNNEVHFMFGEKIRDEDIVRTFKRAVQSLQNKLKVDITSEIPAKENGMTSKIQKWNSIVKKYDENRSCSETAVQRDWEAIISEILGYKRVNDEIRSQFFIHIGAGKRLIPDVVVLKDSKSLFVAELKQYKLPFSSDMKEQIVSYFNQLHISVGILVCAKLYLYSYDYSKNEIVQLEIPFEENNGNGVQFVELFSRENYNESKIRAFIKENSKSALLSTTVSKDRRTQNLTNSNIAEIVSLGQTFHVRTNAELLNDLFGTNYKGWLKCWFHLTKDHKYDLVMLREGEIINGWKNTFEEGATIWHEDFVGSPNEKLPGHKDLPAPYRAFFKKCGDGKQRSYVFYGIYELSEESTLNHRINKKISDMEDFSSYRQPNKPYHKL